MFTFTRRVACAAVEGGLGGALARALYYACSLLTAPPLTTYRRWQTVGHVSASRKRRPLSSLPPPEESLRGSFSTRQNKRKYKRDKQIESTSATNEKESRRATNKKEIRSARIHHRLVMLTSW